MWQEAAPRPAALFLGTIKPLIQVVFSSRQFHHGVPDMSPQPAQQEPRPEVELLYLLIAVSQADGSGGVVGPG